MHYKKLAEFYEEASANPSRLKKIEILAKFLKELDEKDKDLLYLILGDIYPEYDERKIGISNQLAIKAISKSLGIENSSVVSEWKKLGDLGLVVEKLKQKKKQSLLSSNILTVEKVLANLRKLPELEGKGTVEKKLSLIIELLAVATPVESKYIVRTLIGDLRIGLKESTIKEAMALAFFKDDKKESAKKIQNAIDNSNDISLVFEMARKGKLDELKKVSLEVGKPIKVMLAQKAKTIHDGFEAVGKPCAVEYKYDGFRMLIHKNGDDVKLFTRHQL